MPATFQRPVASFSSGECAQERRKDRSASISLVRVRIHGSCRQERRLHCAYSFRRTEGKVHRFEESQRRCAEIVNRRSPASRNTPHACNFLVPRLQLSYFGASPESTSARPRCSGVFFREFPRRVLVLG